MKFKSLLIAGLLLIASQSLMAQEERKHCATDENDALLRQQDPAYAANRAALEAFTTKWIAQHANDKTSNVNGGVKKIIPVVFHVLHNYGSENISDAQIEDAVRIWTRDCMMQNADTSDIVASFKGIKASLDVEFRLATIDPSGNCTNGIDRIATVKTYSAEDPEKLNPWPNNKYLNVWVCAGIGPSHPGAAAYAQFPGGSGLTDGIMCLNTYVGSIGTSNGTNSRTLTHEVGHCFNLYHVWGNTSVGTTCGDDGVSDTPVTKGYTSCSLSNAKICNASITENVQNYMEYSYCDRMFTAGQNSRVQACLTNSLSGRSNLWQPSNLTATGTADPYDYALRPLCAPVADFTSTRQIVCLGDTIRFFDYSFRGKPTSWEWTFPGGMPNNSTDSMPYVQYNTLGTYSVTLTSTNATGSSIPLTKTLYIQVVDPTPQPLPAAEGFENATFPPAGVVVTNPDNSNTWKRTTAAHSTGNGAMTIANSGYKAGMIDEYITPAYDFTNKYPLLTFDRAYALLSADQTRMDFLKIYYSTNCGQTWTLRSSKSGASLTTTTPQSAGWVPTSAQWKADSIPGIYNLLKGKPNVRFKFVSQSAAGNNLYIDNINISGIFMGIDDPDSPVSSFEVYPNPSQDHLNISVTLEKASDLRIELYDITGRKVQDIANEKTAIGIQNYPVTQRLQDGVYFVKLTSGNSTTSKRVVVLN